MLLERRGQVPTVSDTPGASPECRGPERYDMLQLLNKQETIATWVIRTSFKDGVTSEPDPGDELKLISPPNNRILV